MKKVADFKNSKGEWAQQPKVNGEYVHTLSSVMWTCILARCRQGGAKQARSPTYVGCINDFTSFQAFADWHTQQTGYGQGYQLDADMLRKGVKRYSEDTCLLIPGALNNFIASSKARRGAWPQGIHTHGRQLRAQISINGRSTDLGYFDVEDIESARAVYKAAKDKLGKDWASRLVTGEFNVDARAAQYMQDWEHVCDWEHQ